MTNVHVWLISVLWYFPTVVLFAFTQLVYADESQQSAQQTVERELPGGYLARIELNSPQELEAALKRAELLYQDGAVDGEEPVAFVLHGPEVRIFLRENYSEYKPIVDLAARLSAFKVIDIKVCETWMGENLKNSFRLHPFVSTVPFGPDEISRLLNDQNYVHF